MLMGKYGKLSTRSHIQLPYLLLHSYGTEKTGLIISKGYADCVAYMSDGAISVAVAAPEEGLEADAVAQICDIVTTQSDYTPSELKIIEVK